MVSKVQSQLSRHTEVCNVAQETWGALKASVYFTGVKKFHFHACVTSRVHDIVGGRVFNEQCIKQKHFDA